MHMDLKKSFLKVSCQRHWLQRFLSRMSHIFFCNAGPVSKYSWDILMGRCIIPILSKVIHHNPNFLILHLHVSLDDKAEFHSFFRISHTSVINSSIMLLYFSNKYGSRSSYSINPVTRVRLPELFLGCPIFHISPF